MHTWEVNRVAVGAGAKAVCEALRKFGKRCSVRWVNLQCEESRDVRRTDYYSAFWRWFEAIYVANRDGAEFLFEDFRARVQRLRDLEALATVSCWREQVMRCETEQSDVVRAALVSDLRQMRIEAVECIAAQRHLIARIDAELGNQGARAA